jgi:hypothetical protein
MLCLLMNQGKTTVFGVHGIVHGRSMDFVHGPWTLSMDCGRGRRDFDKRRFVHGRGRRGFDNRRFVHGQLNIRMSMDTFETSMDLQV